MKPWSWVQTAAAKIAGGVSNEMNLSEMDSWMDLNSGGQSVTGVSVSSRNAMRAVAVFACVRLISSTIANMPIEVREQEDGEPMPDHPLQKLLDDEPSKLMTAPVLREALLSDCLLAGDFICIIDRTFGGEAVGLRHVDSRNVTVRVRNGSELMYDWHDGKYVHTFFQDDVLHVPCFGVKNYRGISPIDTCRDTIGLALAGQEYAGRFFSNGGNFSGYVKFPGKPTDEQIAQIQKYWGATYTGLKNSHKPAVLAGGAEYQQLNISAEDAQLLEQRQFQVVDIARLFGVPPYLIGSVEKTTSWGKGMEEQNRAFFMYVLLPLINKFEKEVQRKIVRNQGLYVRHNPKAFLRGDQTTRYASHNIARGGNNLPGFMTPNEIRKEEGRAPITGGDTLYTPAQEGSKDAVDKK